VATEILGTIGQSQDLFQIVQQDGQTPAQRPAFILSSPTTSAAIELFTSTPPVGVPFVPVWNLGPAGTVTLVSAGATLVLATSAAPTYTNNTYAPLSADLSGNLRTLASVSINSAGGTVGAVTTGAPAYTPGTYAPLSLDTSGNLRVLSSATSVGTVLVQQGTNPWIVNQTTSVGQFAQQAGTWTVQPGNAPNTTPWLTNATISAGVFAQQAGTWTVQQGGAPWTSNATTSAGVSALQAGTWNINSITSITQSVGVSALQAGTWTVTANQGTNPWIVNQTTSVGHFAQQAGLWNINSLTQSAGVSASIVSPLYGVGTSSAAVKVQEVVSGQVFTSPPPTMATAIAGSGGGSFGPQQTAFLQPVNASSLPLQGTTTSTGSEIGLATRSRQYFGNKATYSVAGATSVNTNSGITTSIAYLFHPASVAKRYQLGRIRVSASSSAGSGLTLGTMSVNLNYISAENATPGGTTFTPVAHDQADPASGSTFRQGATGTPVRGTASIRL
jgi:hypothetical protein